MMKISTVPNTLRHHRERVGLRQIDIARRLGLQSSDRISHWELGVAMPSIVNLFKLAVLYRVPPHELYGELFKTIEQGRVCEGTQQTPDCSQSGVE